jgi:hypothetical protein
MADPIKMENLGLFRDIILGSGSYKFKLAQLYQWVLENPSDFMSKSERLKLGC